MTLPKYAMDYRACKATDLMHFIFSRTLQKQPKRAKRVYTAKLRALDRNVTFRFLDLAPELRVMVYRELLPTEHLADRDREFHTSILRASKDVHQEAEGVLYGTALLPLCLRLHQSHKGGVTTDVQFGHHYPDATRIRHSHRIADLKWPRYVRHFTRVQVHISFRRPPKHPVADLTFYQLSHALYTLTGLLSNSPHFHELRVHIDPTDLPSSAAKAALALAPLAKLDIGLKTSLHGVPDEVVQCLASRAWQWKENQNAWQLPQCQRTLDAARALLAISADENVFPDSGRKRLEARMFQLRESLFRVGYMDAFRDRVILESVVALEELVRSLRGGVRRRLLMKVRRLEDGG
ncbi:hypothetical protein Tdes44962_MAKER09496 [Teratosphaeria destructans]|uniref:Uncharacterized protein n=1 Tax=Teratosphaeria destructans TaxID=418781 RepID=A0A9W7SSV1_9PEZI|nr:hypothetical protein Tdes44962_MAKER09496 [Teratosphaeria destructans]